MYPAPGVAGSERGLPALPIRAHGFEYFFGFKGPAIDCYTHFSTRPSEGAQIPAGTVSGQVGITMDLTASIVAATQQKGRRTHDVRDHGNGRGKGRRILRPDCRSLSQLGHAKGSRKNRNHANGRQADRNEFLGFRRGALGQVLLMPKGIGRCDSGRSRPAPLRREAPRCRKSCACRWRRLRVRHG